MEAAIAAVNEAVEKEDAEGTLASLHNECLDLSEVFSDNAQYYLNELAKRKRGKVEVRTCTYVCTVCMFFALCVFAYNTAYCLYCTMYVCTACMYVCAVRVYVRMYAGMCQEVHMW